MIYDVFIAGLGVMGSAAARALAQAGLQVAGCDAQRPPHTAGSSHGESRIIRSAYFESPIYARLARRALKLWQELQDESGQSLLRITGGLNIGPRSGMLATGALASALEHEIPHEQLDAFAVMRRYPQLRVDGYDVAIFEPDAGILNPERCVTALLASAHAAGAQLFMQTELVDWSRAGTHLQIKTTAGLFEARTLVLALGAWLPTYRPQLPLCVTRQPVFWLEPLEHGIHGPDRLPHYLIEFEPGRIFYGFPDLGHGLKCAIHHEGQITTADTVTRSLDAAEMAQIRTLLARYLPDAAGRLRAASVCLYTNTPDCHFLIDRDPDEAGVWLFSPCSGHGFKFAPALAELLVRAIVQDETSELAWFARSRF